VGRIRTLFPAVHHRRLACEVKVPDTSA
jgi:hypothetical protein